jgi:hypothetical protein
MTVLRSFRAQAAGPSGVALRSRLIDQERSCVGFERQALPDGSSTSWTDPGT